MSAPQLVNVTAYLTCDCGEGHHFPDVKDGWQYTKHCPCGRRVSIQIGDPIVQFDGSEAAS